MSSAKVTRAPGRFLFVTWSGGGNVNPLLALGARLVVRGHVVRVLGPADLGERFLAEGMRYIARNAAAADVIDEVRRGPTDAVVVDYMLPQALAGAESTGIPVAAFVHTLYQRVALAARSPMHMSTDVTGINALRRELGLGAVERLTDLLSRAARVVIVTAPELDRPEAPLPANVRYVDPIVEEPGPDATWRPAGNAPLVVVSLGTTPMNEAPVLQRVLLALAGFPVQVYATIGSHIDAAGFDTPPNAVVARYVRHSAMLPHARLLVTHAGLGSVGAALTFGVPMVCVPLGREQPDNAAHVEALGAGVALPSDVDPAGFGAAVRTVLEEPRFVERARAMAHTIATRGRGQRAVETLEELV